MTQDELALAVMDDDGYGSAITTGPAYIEIPVGSDVWRVVPGSIAEGMARYAQKHLQEVAA